MDHVLRMVSNVPPLFELTCGRARVDFSCLVNPRTPRGKLGLVFECHRCGSMIGRTFDLKGGDIVDPPDAP